MNPRHFVAPVRWIALLGFCIPLLSFAQVDAASNAPERVIWNKTPIAIPLVGELASISSEKTMTSLSFAPTLAIPLRTAWMLTPCRVSENARNAWMKSRLS